MVTSRRDFLSHAAWLVSLAACKGAPALVLPRDRTVEQVLGGMPTMDGAGVQLMRIIGQPALRNLDPFIMLDRFHSEDANAYIKGFPDHPHRGFETVTVMLHGRMRHKDSRGNQGLIQGGGVQWMTAGRGIVHSEMPEQDQGLMSGFQLWLNLPAREKMRAQEYQDLQPPSLAHASLGRSGSSMTVVAGSVESIQGPVAPRTTQPVLFTVELQDDQPLEVNIPQGHRAFVFVHQGEMRLGPADRGTVVGQGSLAVMQDGTRLRLQAPTQASAALVAAARPIGEPIVQRGPFVMNTQAEIEQAYEDYRRGTLGRS